MLFIQKMHPTQSVPIRRRLLQTDLFSHRDRQPLTPESGSVEAQTITEQTEQVCKNIKAVLEAADSSLENVVKTVCFLRDMSDFAAFNEVYGRYFTGKPARSCVAVKELPKNVLVEIDTVAEVSE